MFISHSQSAGPWQLLLFRLNVGFRMQVRPVHLLPGFTLKDHRLLELDLTAKFLKLVLRTVTWTSLSISHWPEQVTWPSPSLMGK